MAKPNESESFFNERLNAAFEEKKPDFSKSLNIAVVGKVSAGKSSLLNAFLRRTRKTMIADVGAISGVTTRLKVLRLDERVQIVDSPGLDDIEDKNSQVTKDFLRSIDVGIFVVTGSADAGQKKNLDDLRRHCDSVFVVLNKFDEWDRHSQGARDKVVAQWQEKLGVDRIFTTCAFGYDPDTAPDTRLDIRGVAPLRTAVEAFLASRGKDLLLARQMGEKQSYAMKLIVGALLAVGGEAFLPGSAVYITATQAASICALYYLYTGRLLSKQSALASIPAFAGQAIGMNLFLWVSSFLPPTGVVNAAAAAVAIIVTLAMLLTANALFSSGHELHERELLASKFRDLKAQASKAVGDSSPSDWTSSEFWTGIVQQLMYL